MLDFAVIAKGHPERPLAEVFSEMPRCAPLRLPYMGACGVPFAKALPIHASASCGRVAFALAEKSLPFGVSPLPARSSGFQQFPHRFANSVLALAASNSPTSAGSS